MRPRMSKPYDSRPDTLEHIAQVAERLDAVCVKLRARAAAHDQSKLGDIEKPIFDRETPKLRELTYGTPEYKEALVALGPALTHHYANNSHHAEHFADGIAGMDLLDVIEMYCDWCAAVLRAKDGSMDKSLPINEKRYNIEPQLAAILRNTFARHGDFS